MVNLLQLIKTYDDFKEEGTQPKTAQKKPGASAAPFPKFDEAIRPAAPRAQNPQTVAAPRPAASSPPPAQAAPTPPPPASVAPPRPSRPVETPEAPAAAGLVKAPIAPIQPTAADHATPDPSLGARMTGVSTAPAAPDTEAEALYRQALLSVSRLFEAAVMENITPGRLASTVTELEELCPLVVASTTGGRGLLRKAMGTYAEGEGFVLPHSVNVAILAVQLGGELEFAEQSLLDLCLAGFIHDIGSVNLPQGLLTKSESLTPSEWDDMRSRPTQSYETIRRLGSRYEQVAQISHQVYERLDGSGYPKGLQDDEILPEARILGTVDFFESFAHPRPYKTTLPGTANHGIQMLMQMADKFGAATLKALVGSIGLFPIGSYVRLSSGEIGRVVDVKKENPMRPEVEVLLNGEHQPSRNPRTLDLLALPHIYVSRALTASDLRELGLLPPPSEMPKLARLENDHS